MHERSHPFKAPQRPPTLAPEVGAVLTVRDVAGDGLGGQTRVVLAGAQGEWVAILE